MPRKRQTMSGADAQNIKSVPGQRYGEGKEQQALQQAMPAPDLASPEFSAGPPTFPGMPPAAPTAIDPMAVQGFLNQTKPNLLGMTGRPDEPVTAGLASGPGPGPEVMRNTAPIRRYLDQLTADTGNPKWRRLAERAGL